MPKVQVPLAFPSRKNAPPISAKNKENSLSPEKPPQTSPKKPVLKRSAFDNLNDASPPKQECLKTSSPSSSIRRLSLSVDKSDQLTTAIRALHSSQPSFLPGRETIIDELTALLSGCLSDKKSASLYISGPPGTGKTACLRNIIAQPPLVHYKTVYVNCTGIQSAKAVYTKIAEQLNIKVKANTEKSCLKAIETYLRSSRSMILLILDEIDQLETRNQSILYTIFEWPSLPKAQLVLVGVANALDLTDRVLPRLQTRCELKPTLFHFASYTKQEIIAILKHRLQRAGVENVLPEAALQLLASKVAAVNGDIRRALDVARRVIELAQTSENRSEKVTLSQVLAVVSNVYGTASSLSAAHDDDSEDCFPIQQKLLICSALLIQLNSNAKEMTVGRLHDVHRKVCKLRNMTPLDLSEFLSLTELVESRGVLKFLGKTKNKISKLILLWNEKEVLNAVKDSHLLSTILSDKSCLSK